MCFDPCAYGQVLSMRLVNAQWQQMLVLGMFELRQDHLIPFNGW